jgi:hypothetical protein
MRDLKKDLIEMQEGAEAVGWLLENKALMPGLNLQ